MADFDAILRKALAARPGAPGDERRKIYERARQALVRQLTGFEPPLPPEDISRQRLALEAAIRKVEADVAGNGGILPGTPAPAAPAPAAPAPTAPARPVSRATPVAPPAPIPPAAPVAAPQPAVAAPVPAPVAATPAAPMPPASATQAPSFEGPRLDPPPTFDSPVAAPPEPFEVPPTQNQPDFQPEQSQAPQPKAKRGSGMAGMVVGVLGLILIAGGGVAAWQLGLLDPYLATSEEEPVVAVEEPLEQAPEVRTIGSDPTQTSERLLPDNQGTIEQTPEQPEPEPEPETPEVATADPAPTGLPVAQTAILYEEGLTADADGFTAPGRALWQLDDASASPAVVGTIEIPARGISLSLRITRNLDDALPATHLLEFTFELSEAFPANSVAELVGVVVKPQEQAGGDPLRGAIVDLGNGVFWQALAAGEADQAVNVPLLRDGRWFDLPILYDDNRRAIITFEKGNDGVAVFQQALNAWSSQ